MLRMMPNNGSLKILYSSALLVTAIALFSCSSEESQQEAEGEAPTQEISEAEFDQDWYDLEEAQQLASENDRWVQVYVHVNWCHFCMQMEDETFTDEGVKGNLDSWYYPVSLNAESQDEVRFNGNTYTEEELARNWGVNSYPGMVFIDPEGEIFAQESGYVEARTYRQILEYIGTHAYEEQSFDNFAGS